MTVILDFVTFRFRIYIVAKLIRYKKIAIN